MSAIAILIFIALIVWGLYARHRFFAKGSHPAHQQKPPDLANFAPPAKAEDPESQSQPPKPPNPPPGQP